MPINMMQLNLFKGLPRVIGYEHLQPPLIPSRYHQQPLAMTSDKF